MTGRPPGACVTIAFVFWSLAISAAFSLLNGWSNVALMAVISV